MKLMTKRGLFCAFSLPNLPNIAEKSRNGRKVEKRTEMSRMFRT